MLIATYVMPLFMDMNSLMSITNSFYFLFTFYLYISLFHLNSNTNFFIIRSATQLQATWELLMIHGNMVGMEEEKHLKSYDAEKLSNLG
jgi:hypothetical protein